MCKSNHLKIYISLLKHGVVLILAGRNCLTLGKYICKYIHSLSWKKQERLSQSAGDKPRKTLSELTKPDLQKLELTLEAEKEGLRIIYVDHTHAMRIGDFDKIYLLIDNYGADVNWEDTYGNTPLIAACRYGLRLPIRNLIERRRSLTTKTSLE